MGLGGMVPVRAGGARAYQGGALSILSRFWGVDLSFGGSLVEREGRWRRGMAVGDRRGAWVGNALQLKD